jgi:hypothetical protein
LLCGQRDRGGAEEQRESQASAHELLLACASYA